MATWEIENVTIETVRGDIACQPDMDVIVNAANAQLRIGGGVAGAIHRAAGPGLEREARSFAPIRPGEAVITSAHELPNRYVVHCLGPVYGRDEPPDELLAACYRNALRLAEDSATHSIAFPAISSGAFGYPFEAAARVALEAVLGELEGLSFVKHVRFVLFSEEGLQVYEQLLEEIES